LNSHSPIQPRTNLGEARGVPASNILVALTDGGSHDLHHTNMTPDAVPNTHDIRQIPQPRKVKTANPKPVDLSDSDTNNPETVSNRQDIIRPIDTDPKSPEQ
jgi:hypothetical protein